jgi:hypothetical protein
MSAVGVRGFRVSRSAAAWQRLAAEFFAVDFRAIKGGARRCRDCRGLDGRKHLAPRPDVGIAPVIADSGSCLRAIISIRDLVRLRREALEDLSALFSGACRKRSNDKNDALATVFALK